MFRLTSLPYEVLSFIIGYLNLEDVFSLFQTCHFMKLFLRDERLCQSILQSKLYHSEEARQARSEGGHHASALRRAVKRREAIATADPYVVAMVAIADEFIYSKGILCYVLDQSLRVLNVGNSYEHELVINIPHFLTLALSGVSERSKGVFRILHHSDDVISCLYTSSHPEVIAWLIAFRISNQDILIVEELDSSERIFVRNDEQYLYYGTHSGFGHNNHKIWVVSGFHLQTGKSLGQKVQLSKLVGSEIGSTVCFELHDGFFYALSNQTSFEMEEIDWTSFYHCIKFPLESPCQNLMQCTDDKSMWRRQHQEGPIDDRWTILSLDVSETSGKIKIIETRKEWHEGNSRSQRTYYTTKIIFPQESKENMEMRCETTNQLSSNSSFSTKSSTDSSSSSTTQSSTLGSSSSSSTISVASSSTTITSRMNLPQNDPLTHLLRDGDKPNYMVPPERELKNTHCANDTTAQPAYTLFHVRHYYTYPMAYLDLINAPLPTDIYHTQRLCLRVGSRKLLPPSPSLAEHYADRPVAIWPRPGDDELSQLLNPPSHLGNVQGMADERTVVYATGSTAQPRAIVLIGFDPGMYLPGLQRWRGPGVGEGPHINGRATGSAEKGKGKQRAVEQVVGVGAPWASRERAMYLDIGLGFYFGKDKAVESM